MSPPLVAREARPTWPAVWRFRLVVLSALALFVWLLFLLFQEFSGANDQDPGVDALATHLVAAWLLRG